MVFAGGLSRRMKRDKALVPLGGRTLLERAVATVKEAGGEPMVLGAVREVPGLEGVRFEDETGSGGERLGPLHALRHGLKVTRARIVTALACDLPLVPPDLLRFLAEAARQNAAVVPVACGELQVLAAGYSSSCLEIMDRRIAAGRLSLRGFLREVDARLLKGDELLPFGGEEIFLNVNTPEDLAKAESILGPRTA
jgi:molybdenum cofactor guanylyltransferase